MFARKPIKLNVVVNDSPRISVNKQNFKIDTGESLPRLYYLRNTLYPSTRLKQPAVDTKSSEKYKRWRPHYVT